MKRCVFLVSKLSGYLIACLRELESQTGCDILVCHWPVAQEAPYDQALFDSVGSRFEKSGMSREVLTEKVMSFAPDFIFISGWMDRDYLAVARQVRKSGIPVIAGCDTQWRGNLRQRIACLMSSRLLHPAVDVFWVSGDRQREFVKRLGYDARRCLEGFYTCDSDAFREKEQKQNEGDPFYLYVGRLMERKGTDVLLKAYQRYRERVNKPWRLRIVGNGPMSDNVIESDGVDYLGFLQPDKLPEVYQKAACFVMPSRYEPWCVAIHEATSAGVPVICTTACGAGVHLVRDGHNGYKCESGDVSGLESAMVKVSEMPKEARQRMAECSRSLSKQYSPVLWVATLTDWLNHRKRT